MNLTTITATHSEENRALSEEMFARLQAAGCIAEREIRQLYDGEKKMFLPDRYVRGECPKCAAADQYGDSCERCGAAYAPEDLKNPVSALSGARALAQNFAALFFAAGRDARGIVAMDARDH